MPKYNQVAMYVLVLLCSLHCKVRAQDIQVLVKTQEKFQTIKGFGASDAWRVQFVGNNWPKHKKEEIAELLFSKEEDENGNPKGIGLSIWRFYIGAGSMEQGPSSGIVNEWRRAESFLDENGTYHWGKQAGQQWFLNQARDYQVDHLLAFSIAPPVFWAQNKKGYPEKKLVGMNIIPERLGDYATFLVDVVEEFRNKGYSIDFLSPVNEPQWDWGKGSQEGTQVTNEEIYTLCTILDKEIKKRKLPVKIIAPEAADLRFLIDDYKHPTAGDQITTFFGENSDNNLRALDNIVDGVAGHSYFTTAPVDSLIAIRKRLEKIRREYNIEYWQSEFCILEDTQEFGKGPVRDLGMNTALYVARVIHADLVLANASSWQWWTAISNADYKDGLIYLDTGIKGNLNDLEMLKSDGEYRVSKLLWVLGNYSRFIRPGMTRIGVDLIPKKNVKKEFENCMVSGYMDDNQIVLVAINYQNKIQNINIEIPKGYKLSETYETSEKKNLAIEKPTESSVKLEARSVTSVILKRA